MRNILKLLTWPAALFIAGILLWYEQFKLTANPGSVELFTTLATWIGIPSHEAAFRLFVAWAEIAASVLVINRPSRGIGALGTLALMSGAIFFHVASPLGIDPYNDGGTLFKEACAVWAASLFTALVLRDETIAFLARLGFAPAWLARLS